MNESGCEGDCLARGGQGSELVCAGANFSNRLRRLQTTCTQKCLLQNGPEIDPWSSGWISEQNWNFRCDENRNNVISSRSIFNLDVVEK